MPKYYVSYNNYFGYCVVEEINGTGKIVFTGSIEKCNQKCIELNAEAINMIQQKRSDLGASQQDENQNIKKGLKGGKYEKI